MLEFLSCLLLRLDLHSLGVRKISFSAPKSRVTQECKSNPDWQWDRCEIAERNKKKKQSGEEGERRRHIASTSFLHDDDRSELIAEEVHQLSGCTEQSPMCTTFFLHPLWPAQLAREPVCKLHKFLDLTLNSFSCLYSPLVVAVALHFAIPAAHMFTRISFKCAVLFFLCSSTTSIQLQERYFILVLLAYI